MNTIHYAFLNGIILSQLVYIVIENIYKIQLNESIKTFCKSLLSKYIIYMKQELIAKIYKDTCTLF